VRDAGSRSTPPKTPFWSSGLSKPNRVDSWTLGLAIRRSERSFLDGLGGDPGSHGGFWGGIGGSADACGSHLPTAGEYGSPGCFLSQARPLYGRAPLQAGKERALNKRARDQPVLNGGLVGILGARWMHIDHTYPLPESMAPKGALRAQHARFPNAHPKGALPYKAPINARLRQSGRDKRYKQGSGINANKRSINANKRKRNYSSVNIAVQTKNRGSMQPGSLEKRCLFRTEVLRRKSQSARTRRATTVCRPLTRPRRRRRRPPHHKQSTRSPRSQYLLLLLRCLVTLPQFSQNKQPLSQINAINANKRN
jgi:hypothetical protein